MIEHAATKRWCRHLLLLMLAFELGMVCLRGQTIPPHVEIGDHEIMLGKPADKLVTALQQTYTLRYYQDEKSGLRQWIVTRGNGRDTTFFGTLYAKGNTIVGVESERETNTPQDMFDYLFGASSKFSDERRNVCETSTWNGYLTGPMTVSKASVSFTCGAYRLNLLRNEFTADGQLVAGYVFSVSLGTTE
jgi:hypothetical protein